MLGSPHGLYEHRAVEYEFSPGPPECALLHHMAQIHVLDAAPEERIRLSTYCRVRNLVDFPEKWLDGLEIHVPRDAKAEFTEEETATAVGERSTGFEETTGQGPVFQAFHVVSHNQPCRSAHYAERRTGEQCGGGDCLVKLLFL